MEQGGRREVLLHFNRNAGRIFPQFLLFSLPEGCGRGGYGILPTRLMGGQESAGHLEKKTPR